MEPEQEISTEEAIRIFPQLLEAVRQGCTFVVTSHGKPVAIISPPDMLGRAEGAARHVLLSRLRQQRAGDAGEWMRDDLYEDDA